MKNMKKLLALLLALAICAVFALPALATGDTGDGGTTVTDPTTTDDVNIESAPPGPCSLTVDEAQKGHTYALYQLLKGTVAIDGETLSDPVAGDALGTIESLKFPEGTKLGDETVTEVKDEKELIAVLATFNTNTEKLDQFIALNLEQFKGADTKSIRRTVGEDGQFTWDGLDAGYYLVVDETAKVPKGDARSAVMVKVVSKTTTITSKHSAPTQDKKIVEGENKVEATEKSIGDVVTFELTTTVDKENLSKYDSYKLKIIDTMSEGLTYKEFVSITITGVDDENEKLGQIIPRVEPKVVNPEDSEDKPGTVLTVEIPNLFDITGKPAEGDTGTIEVVVTYTATLNENAVIAPNPNPNEVYLEYSNDPDSTGDGDTGTTPKKEVYVYTFKIEGSKVDGDGEPLANAKFILKASKDGEAIKFVVKEGKYVKYDELDQNAETTTEIVSGSDGLFELDGLKPGTYYLEETEAPNGYHKLTSDIEIEIKGTTEKTEEVEGKTQTTITYNNGTTTVTNEKGSLLPSTGGIGTTIFYTVGAILVVGAGVLLFTKKRIGSKG